MNKVDALTFLSNLLHSWISFAERDELREPHHLNRIGQSEVKICEREPPEIVECINAYLSQIFVAVGALFVQGFL